RLKSVSAVGLWAPYDLPMTTSLADTTLTVFLKDQEASWLAEQLVLAAEEDPVIRARLSAAAGVESAADDARTLVLETVADHLPDVEHEDIDPLHRVIDLIEDLMEYGFEDEAADIAGEARDLYEEQFGDDGSEHLGRLHALIEGQD